MEENGSVRKRRASDQQRLRARIPYRKNDISDDLRRAVETPFIVSMQQDVSIGVRHIPMAVPIMAEAARYFEVLKKYPPQLKIGFTGN